MNKYKILLIDEQLEDIDSFLDYVENSSISESFQVEKTYPLETIEEMIEYIISSNPDAIITDFLLNDIKKYIKYNVPYNGVDIVNEFLKIKEKFPCFIITSFDSQAINSANDVNIVYVKSFGDNETPRNGNITFLEKVKFQIDKYRNMIKSYEEEVKYLTHLREAQPLTIIEEERLIQLYSMLEKSIDKRSGLPVEFLRSENSNKIEELIRKTDEIINELNNTDSDE